MNKLDLIDIGCNLASQRLLKDLERILHDIEDAGVSRQILTGSEKKSNNFPQFNDDDSDRNNCTRYYETLTSTKAITITR